MPSKNVFIFLSLFQILIGIFFLIASIKNLGQGATPRKLSAIMIKRILGEKGTRIFVGIIGIGFILYGIYMFTTKYVGIEIFPKKSYMVTLEEKIIQDPNSEFTTTAMNTSTTIKNMERIAKIVGDKSLNDYIKIRFYNHQLESIPEIVWRMQNLEEIDLTKNRISELPIEKLKKLKNLKILILTENPIDKSELNRVQSELKIEIKTN